MFNCPLLGIHPYWKRCIFEQLEDLPFQRLHIQRSLFCLGPTSVVDPHSTVFLRPLSGREPNVRQASIDEEQRGSPTLALPPSVLTEWVGN